MNNHTNHAIQLAAENRWKPDMVFSCVEEDNISFDRKRDNLGYTEKIISIYEAFLDPLFWQSLGKALGWEGEHCYVTFEHQEYAVEDESSQIDLPENEETRHYEPIWLYHQHRLIDHLSAGKSPEEFFGELLKDIKI